MGKTSSAVKDRWKNANYDNFRVFVRKGSKEELQAYCEAHGTTMGGLVKKLLEEHTGIKLTSDAE